jgi:menaquinol-cytochrome c reductase cytochrome b/c subunit
VAHHHDEEKIVYVGDSRVRVRDKKPMQPDFSAYPGKSEVFVPNFLLKEWMVGAVVLVGFMVLVLSHPAPLGYIADPNNTEFIPMPDWYFLFLYQFLKLPYVSEKFIALGTVGIPGIAFTALMLVPFLDTGKERRFYRRPVTSSIMFLTLIAIFYLTWQAWDHYQHELETRGITPEHILKHEEVLAGKGSAPTPAKKTATIVAQDDPGYAIYKQATCVSCHGADLTGPMPSLLGIGDKYTQEEIMDIIVNGKGGMQPQLEDNLARGLTEADIETLASWLAMQKAE